jgi:hypothetical protein
LLAYSLHLNYVSIVTTVTFSSKVKPPKAGKIVRWMTFLALDVQGTLPLMVYPIIAGVSR